MLNEIESIKSNRGDSNFAEHSTPWALQADKIPAVVLAPSSTKALQEAVKALCESSLDFAMRNTGTGSASASDVILSMHNFKSFDLDSTLDDETVTIGAGFT